MPHLANLADRTLLPADHQRPSTSAAAFFSDADRNADASAGVPAALIVEQAPVSPQEALQAAFANPREALNQAAIVAITDARGNIVAVNQKFCDLSGYTQDELIGRNHRLLKSGVHDRAFFQNLYRSISRGKTWHGTLCNRAKGGHLYWVDTTIVPNRSADGKILGYTAIRFDVTPLTHARQELWNQAHFDVLTGAANRRHFLSQLEERTAQAKQAPFHVAMLDLDHFKEVNDAGGHNIGDQLLRNVADIIGTHLHDDELLGRLGGDEFAMILRASDAPATLDQRLRAMLQDIYAHRLTDSAVPRSTASIGLSRFPNDGDNSHELMRRADLALYAAKREGGDDWRAFQITYEAEAERRLDLRTRFFQAFANKQIHIYYQPIISLCASGPPAFEALVRWIDDDGTILTPGSFSEILQEEATAREIGNLALNTAINQIQQWNAAGMAFSTISVNATGPDLRSDMFVGRIVDAILSGQIRPNQLAIEITEGMLLDRQARRVRSSIDKLHQLGIRIAFDDFGTGFASLTHLRELPIHVVKIDRSFVQAICNSSKDRVIVDSLITLSHRLGLQVVAEGVETEDQMRMLARMGCDRIQGFLIAEALNATVAQAFLENVRA
ncbi:putative bifunctional diguanylate cyclase/phosphodiesterase [Sphingopyxis yananensis]|uniref:putative bifunctional diguanylate cyclase/phosphodiesterase n=1 Tax=Sphingopyxis yananensis TaxID=2886687 RepID=UPI001D12491C|nr:GGDEF domain-containing phosphodiesterase [Sphingopyxis yananensis]MCC2602473.1 EAL domain-containing protein [Sphingopyxis yananensis]